jgi:hypothetical protein
MPDPDEIVRQIMIDIRLDSYQSFFDHAWANKFIDLTDKSRLRTAGFDLSRDWKGIAVATRMPWLVIDALKNFHIGYTKSNVPFHVQLTDRLAEYLTKDAGFSNMGKKKLLAKLHELRADVEKLMEQSKPAFDLDALWNDFLRVKEFGLALWNAQRLAYGAIYYAYENFVQRVNAAGRREDDYRAPNFDRLCKDFTSLFSDAMTRECLRHPDIDTVRLVRNCLTHDGGRVSAKLRPVQHGIRVKGDEVHIFPEDTLKLFNLLKDRALKVAQQATTVPAFSI